MARQKGFTLIEVLVAGFILFLAVSTVTLVFSSAIKSKASATDSVRLSAYVPLIRDHIKIQLRQERPGTTRGEGYFMGVEYSWNAKVSESAPPAPEFSAEDKSFVVSDIEVLLWEVQLVVDTGTRSRETTFYTVGWNA